MKSFAFFLLAAAVLLAREVALQPTAPTTSPENYDFIFSSPSDCAPSSCTIFAGVNLNQGDSNYVDIYLEGAAGGYVAVGFTATQDMFNADVVACTRDSSNDMIQALDTWNPGSRGNQQDATNDVTLFSGSFVNGRIRCSVAKRIIGSDSSQDINLNSNLYMIYALRSSLTSPTVLQQHGFSQNDRDFSPNTFSFPPMATTNPPPTMPPTTEVPTTEGPMTTAGTTTEPTTQAPPVAPLIEPEEYRLIFREPAGCNASECDIFVGIDTNTGNSDYLDIYLEAAADGWVAVGFSDTRSMFETDVVACVRDPVSKIVSPLDSWNPSSVRISNRDPTQDVYQFEGRAANERIECRVAKRIVGSDAEQDIDLDNDLYVLYTRRIADMVSSATPITLVGNQHDTLPFKTEQRFNPTVDETPVVQSTTAAPPAVTVPGGVVPPSIQPEDSRLIFRVPAGCAPSECDIFVGIDTNTGNSDYLDIFLEGEADGWVAVGFSETQSMFSSDVVACTRDPGSGIVTALDNWNLASPDRGSQTDPIQDIVLFEGVAENGRLRCSVAKPIIGSEEDRDLDLDNDLYVLIARRESAIMSPGSGSNIFTNIHDAIDNRIVSSNVTNPVTAGGEGEAAGDPAVRNGLTRAHGILMLIAWPLLAVSGIFFAAWMKPALPNGEWFQVHRAFMIASLFIGLAGFIFIFIANKDNSPTRGLIDLSSENKTGRAHFAIGIIVMFLHILNPLLALFRCKPDHKFRWIFNIIHGTSVGIIVKLLALANVGIGLSIFSNNFSRFEQLEIFWVFIALLVFAGLLGIIMFITLAECSRHQESKEEQLKTAPPGIKLLLSDSCSKCPTKSKKPKTEGEEETEVELEVMKGEKLAPVKEKKETRKPPSKDSPLRWIFLTILWVVLIPVIIALVVLVALP